MITKGSTIAANVDHFDDHYGDIYIESGDKFKVLDEIAGKLTLEPLDERKFRPEPTIISHVEYFNEVH